MKITIIGAGNVGKALGTSATRVGHEVAITATTTESASAAAEQVGAAAADDSAEAVRDADLVILAVPYVGAGRAVADEIREAARGRVVVDATNPIKADYSGLATNGKSGAEELQALMPGARVVKAFNTVFAANQARPSREIDAYVAGDDAHAKATVMELADAMGFAAIDVGPLAAARQLEGMAWLNIGLNAANGWDWTSAWRLRR